MREIKFRAWDTNKRKMIYPTESTVVTEDGEYDSYTQPIPSPRGILWIPCSWSSLKYVDFEDIEGEIMQFTGLKDKNGKEIYEGDIVKYCDTLNENYSYETVEWDKEYCGFKPMCIYDCDCYVYTNLETIEIIGNIYENPELMEKKDGN